MNLDELEIPDCGCRAACCEHLRAADHALSLQEWAEILWRERPGEYASLSVFESVGPLPRPESREELLAARYQAACDERAGGDPDTADINFDLFHPDEHPRAWERVLALMRGSDDPAVRAAAAQYDRAGARAGGGGTESVREGSEALDRYDLLKMMAKARRAGGGRPPDTLGALAERAARNLGKRGVRHGD